MPKILLAALLAVLATAAQAQQRTYYDGAGRVTGRSTTDSQGSSVYYDAAGRVSARSSTNGDQTQTYDSRGRTVGRSTSPQR